jgi:integrase
MTALADHMRWYEKNVESADPELFIFPFGSHRKYDRSKPVRSLKTAWTTLRRKTGIWVRLHDTRHTVVTKLGESGAGDEAIRAMAGYTSRRMLERYSHIRVVAKRRALEEMRNVANDNEVDSNESDNEKSEIALEFEGF